MDATEWRFAPYPKDVPPKPQGKPWRVTAYRSHWYWGSVEECFVVGDYRWYWLANAVSFVWHHLLGYGCNTWKAKVK